MPEFPIPSARILLVSQIQGGRLPPCPPVRYAYGFVTVVAFSFFSFGVVFYVVHCHTNVARDVQAKLALIVAQCLSIHLSICVSICLSATA